MLGCSPELFEGNWIHITWVRSILESDLVMDNDPEEKVVQHARALCFLVLDGSLFADE